MILIKNSEQIELIKKAGTILADCLSFLSLQVQPGITGLQIDKIADDYIQSMGGTAACKGFEGYENALCISVNAGAVHCIPNNKPFQPGDVVKLDLVVDYNGWKADSAITCLVPPVKPEVQRLATVGVQALQQGILAAKEGSRVSDITQAVFNSVTGTGFSLVKEYVGHGIGRGMHEDPQIPCIPQNKPSPLLVSGMVICIEPIVIGSLDNSLFYRKGQWDTWSISGSPVVHNEHTILITPQGPEILTLRSNEYL